MDSEAEGFASQFPPSVWRKGREWASSGKILASASIGDFVEAQAIGSHGEPYRVKILLEDARLRSASCTCPARGRCKHMAGLLIAFKEGLLDRGANATGTATP